MTVCWYLWFVSFKIFRLIRMAVQEFWAFLLRTTSPNSHGLLSVACLGRPKCQNPRLAHRALAPRFIICLSNCHGITYLWSHSNEVWLALLQAWTSKIRYVNALKESKAQRQFIAIKQKVEVNSVWPEFDKRKTNILTTDTVNWKTEI